MTEKPPVDDVNDDDIEVGPPREWAAGVPGVLHSMEPAIKQLGLARTVKLMTSLNQKDGFDCMSCAWPDPNHRKVAEFCENGAKAVTWEANPVLVPDSFWAEHSIDDLLEKSEYWLGMQGRLTTPVHKPVGSDHYEPVSWERAFEIIGDRLNSLDSPDEASFYTSGRTSNEAAFEYQLFVRAFGTNNLPDCSNMCHESTGAAMGETVGVGKSTIAYDDFEQADLIIVLGQNPGTNHPRMLTALEDAKGNGAAIVAVNPLPEAGLRRYKNPQLPRGIVGRGTNIADQFVQIRLGGDMALLQAVAKRVLAAEDAAPGTVLDHGFLAEHTVGLDAFREHIAKVDDDEVLLATGITSAEIDELAERYISAERVIITWAMGITQHRKAVDTIKEIINLLLLRGNIGRPGAGASPIRGHSNVQGDRTMGIWEQMSDQFLDALQREFRFDPPREHGVDALKGIKAMQEGRIKFWMGMGGNLVAAISDTQLAEAAMRGTEMTVQVSTKLNRSHAVVGAEALILPTLGRTEIDVQKSGPQFVSVEDTVCSVHGSHGQVPPVAPDLLSEVAIVSRLARVTLRDRADLEIDWQAFEDDYDTLRDHISRVVPGFERYSERVRSRDGFVLPNGPRDSRTFDTAAGKAMITVNELEHVERPAGRLLLQTLRSHDQYNTTIYSLNDRYRGIKKGREVVFINPDDLAELGLVDGQRVDVFTEWTDDVERVLRDYRVVAYPTARGCAAAYFPEANVLVPLDSASIGSNTPVSKAVLVRVVPAAVPATV
ncbi:FdhF/YdeP family oxidoreductase [Frigoribacterium sp. CFBP9039]|uniref:FdhF/YdeP family oxidoreductase n=1 Tax=Frigoribacterium sp. CFBP9029 TaxID=3096541 RepID=UPI002A69A42E|nr:FdhF/YdeP family oxidoreductase [Frigoribacterium sp. CFBP9039]MDY0944726.1 FdhF/YdeP family oxidoreductase [Frigoribacterium sp. CFBP9039]